MPGTDKIRDPMARVTANITIRAPAEKVWPWIAQIGSGRAGWYSYDWIDNGGRPSATMVLPQYQHLVPGDVVPAIPGSTDAFIVAEVAPPTSLVLVVPDGRGGHQVRYEFRLEQLAASETRLTVRGILSARWPTNPKSQASSGRSRILIERVYGVLLRLPKPIKLGVAYVGHHFMESRMLHGIKRRAETN